MPEKKFYPEINIPFEIKNSKQLSLNNSSLSSTIKEIDFSIKALNTVKSDSTLKFYCFVIVSNGGLKMDEKTAPHLEELTRALGDLEKTGIRAEFEKLIAFRVPPDVAKESILRKFGGKRKVLKVKDLSA